jgi:hypothetical protein
MLELKDTVANQIEVLDDGTTIADILKDLGWARRERERCRIKDSKRRTGNPPGRPRKNPPSGEGLKPGE